MARFFCSFPTRCFVCLAVGMAVGTVSWQCCVAFRRRPLFDRPMPSAERAVPRPLPVFPVPVPVLVLVASMSRTRGRTGSIVSFLSCRLAPQQTTTMKKQWAFACAEHRPSRLALRISESHHSWASTGETTPPWQEAPCREP